jgi:hypothetical protein
MEAARWEYDDQPKLLPPPKKRATNRLLPDPVVLEAGEDYDVIEHPYEEGATAKFWHSGNGAVRRDGSAGGKPGTVIIGPDVDHAPEFFDRQIKTSERGRELLQMRWEKSRQAMRDGIEKAVREGRGIPEHLMTNELATAVIAEMLTKRVLDTDEPLRDVTKTTQFLLEKSQALPDARTQRDVPEIAIQINIEAGLLSGGFDED